MSRPLTVLGALAIATACELWFHTSREVFRSSPFASLRVARDPATGQIAFPEHLGRPLGIEEMQAIARREAQGLVTIRNADGSETLNHEGRFREYTVVRKGKDGKPAFQCVHGEAGAAHALHPAAPVDPKREDR